MAKDKKTGYEPLTSIEAISAGLGTAGYISTTQISTAVFLAHGLRKPILIEGPAGVGKTDLAASLAKWMSLPLIRLQCYEGLDEGKALYEWKYGKQLLYTQILKEKLSELLGDAKTLAASLDKLSGFEDLFFSPQFLEARPLLTAMQQSKGSVLLIDEIDKSDEAFEAFLLEVLSDYQVSVPEIGTIRADVPPLVILTSNNVRELGDALKRRCLHLHIGFPDHAREQRIVRARVEGISDTLLNQLVRFVQSVREADIKKRPSIAETVDWARTLLLLHTSTLDEAFVRDTLNVLLKHESDIAAIAPAIPKMVREATGPDARGRLASGYPDVG
ncbi:MAG: MoxR family ATPase [Hyphomonas sp.]|uniref:AAA family ATPase n=1 Tax=Hyphomonas sp. TaxID=87 RepID=UPI00178FE65B|nr:MoxR family ATPase [Hyphomonas sp.]MBA3069783.1 MoxR family ATPase [Hyphomonas sp.]MBU3920918.1 MoxR family ATPase [Alphaproteobacteria bacterium]MBU4062624.1 MoxR family ATPase [Alphaproteobacteria bacterium]MBU4163975.1 MoxR family ATPase [Alphaproteobacteria bacterium]